MEGKQGAFDPLIDSKDVSRFREQVRLLERRLGLLDLIQSECCGLSLSQCHALVEIGRSVSLSLGELSQRLGLDKSTASRVVDSLVNSGNVNRKDHPEDRRLIQLSLTEMGKEKFEHIEQEMYRQFSTVLSSIPREKRAQVLESIDVLLQTLPQIQCCGGSR